MEYDVDMEEAKSLLSPLHYAHLVKHLPCEGVCPVRNGLLKILEDAQAKQYRENLCGICGCDKSEHNWEIHRAEMQAGY